MSAPLKNSLRDKAEPVRSHRPGAHTEHPHRLESVLSANGWSAGRVPASQWVEPSARPPAARVTDGGHTPLRCAIRPPVVTPTAISPGRSLLLACGADARSDLRRLRARRACALHPHRPTRNSTLPLFPNIFELRRARAAVNYLLFSNDAARALRPHPTLEAVAGHAFLLVPLICV